MSGELWVKPMADYNQNSSYQASANQHNSVLLKEQAKQISELFSRELHVADFGCSHGKNSMECVKVVFDGYTVAPESIRVYLNDLPTNEFGEVFNCLNDPEISYNQHKLALQSRVSTCVNGQTFSTQCFPDDHLHLSFTFHCLHWLEKPVRLSKALFPNSSRVSSDEASRIARDAHLQLVAFFKSRAKELKKGGRLVASFGKDSSNLLSMEEIWIQFIEKQGYNLEDFAEVALPIYNRTEHEVQRALEEVKTEFRVLLFEPYIHKSKMVATGTMKSATSNVIVTGLQKTKLFASIPECENFAEKFYGSFTESPMDDITFHTLVLERK